MKHIFFCITLLVASFGQPLFGVEVPVLTISDTINVGSADYIQSGIESANEKNAPLIIVQLDTEGGTLQATRTIVKAILNSRSPVVVFVTPKGGHATSAGTFITLAADVAVMSPGTHIGAAHPVLAQGKMDDVMKEKATKDTAAFAESLAKAKGRNTVWARLAVEKSESVIAKTALDKNVIDFMADDLPQLLEKLPNHKLRVQKNGLSQIAEDSLVASHVEPSIRHRLLSFFAHPQMALWILSLGGLCIWIELSNPGLILPGILGGICVILSLISLQMLPIHYGALALILFGMGMMVAEIFVTSYGLLGIGGVLSFVFGSLFLIDTDVPGFQITLLDVLPMAAVLTVGVLVLAYLVLRSRKSRVQSGMESLVGEYAEVKEQISDNQEGKVFIFGELWKARSTKGGAIPPKAIVVVKEVHNMLLVVEPQEKQVASKE